MSKKDKPYLPLKWTEYFMDVLRDRQVFGDTGITPEEIRMLIEPQYSQQERVNVLKKHSRFSMVLSHLHENAPERVIKETMSDLNAMSVILLWAKNKQVYSLDKDFINELVNTETVTTSKDAWDFLPYNTFYIDLSANKEVCERIIGEGMFIRVVKTSSPVQGDDQSLYMVSICKVTDKLFFNDEYFFINTDFEQRVDEMNFKTHVPISRSPEQIFYMNGASPEQTEFDGKSFDVLIPQILSYLSSVEPDIGENELTKKTYRKPQTDIAPKNKFSEIQRWDVGVRFGTAFRKWKTDKSSQKGKDGHHEEIVSGYHSKQRPHSRRAHWSHYWYGHGENKVKRPKWVNAYFVNIKEQGETPTVIHKVDGKN